MFAELTSNNLLNAILEASSDLVCIINNQLEVEYSNQAFSDLVFARHGYKPIPGKYIFSGAPQETITTWQPALLKALGGETITQTIVRPELPDMNYVKVTLSPIVLDNVVQGTLIRIKDITAESVVERDLDAFKLLASNLPNTDVFLCDSTGKVLLAEGGEMKKYGRNSEFFIGKSLFQLGQELGINLSEEIHQALKGKQISRSVQYKKFHYAIDIVPLGQRGKVNHIIYLSRNVTELHGATMRLQRLNETKDSILSVVAHDLKNPITAMLGLGEMINSGQFQQMHISMYASIINQTCNNAMSIINDLLDIAELGKDEFKLELEVTELNYFVRQSIKTFTLMAQQKGIEIEFENTRPDLFAAINPDKFNRVLTNLISNAIKFSKPGGKVLIKTALLPEQRILISCTDFGIGIPEKLQKIIFDKFTKAGRSGTLGEKSLGLGMSIVKQIVTLHHGNIWLKSKENEGTTVFIELKSAI